MPQTPQGRSNEEQEAILAAIREANRAHAAGKISWKERVARHQAVVPDIGNLERGTKGRPIGRRERTPQQTER